MDTKKKIIIGIITLTFLLSICLYSNVPDKMATHWDLSGNVNGYMSKIYGVFLLPFLSIILTIILVVIPKFDPMYKNIEKFRKYYDNFIIIFLLFLLIIQTQILLWNVGYKLNPGYIISIGLSVLFYSVGVLSENSKRNYSIGFRTPWTLSSDVVWSKTNKLGGKLFKIFSVLPIIGLFFIDYFIYVFVIPLIGVILFIFFYSYYLFKKIAI